MTSSGDVARKVVVFGAGKLAEMSHFYLTHDSPHEVVGFTADGDYIEEETLLDLPMVPFERVEKAFPPEEYGMSVFLGFRDVNRFRAARYSQALAKGYSLVGYVSSTAVVWPGATIGSNCFVHESVIIQPFASIGDNVVVGAGALISHHSVVKDHCFVGANATILGGSVIETHCVLGAGCTITDSIVVARESIIGAGATVANDTVERGVYVGHRPELLPRRSDELSWALTWSRDSESSAADRGSSRHE